jgi:hypothetical protein
MGAEKRKFPRLKIDLLARIEMADGSTAPGTMLDLSQGGVRLKVRQPGNLPEQFLLRLAGGVRRWSRIAWRSDTEIGVEFLAAPQEPADGAAKRAVVIKCPNTGKRVATGIQLMEPHDLNTLSTARRFTQCPSCRVVHGWTPADAFLEEIPNSCQASPP